MMPLLIPPDLKRWAVPFLSLALAAQGIDADVSDRTPKRLPYPLAKPFVTIDELTPTKYDLVQFDQALAVNIRAGTRQNGRECDDLARLIAGILTDPTIVDAEASPITSVGDLSGPNPVDDQADVARAYLTVEYHCVGEIR